MNVDLFKNATEAMEAHFNRKLSNLVEDRRRFMMDIWMKISDLPDSVVHEVFDSIIRGRSTLPTFDEYERLLLEAGRRQRAASGIAATEGESEKRKAEETERVENMEALQPQVRAGVELFDKLMSRQITRREYVEGLRALEEKYPFSGWAACADKHETWCDERGIGLDTHANPINRAL